MSLYTRTSISVTADGKLLKLACEDRAQVGVDNIREYMEQNAAATEEFTKRRMALTSQVTTYITSLH